MTFLFVLRVIAGRLEIDIMQYLSLPCLRLLSLLMLCILCCVSTVSVTSFCYGFYS